LRLFTVGHSTRSLEELVRLLRQNGVRRLIDVRTLPGSRKVPQFNREVLRAALAQTGIDYVHMRELGGLRKPRPDSENTGWRNSSFRGFADHMQTIEFGHALERLIELAEEEPSAIMCAEAVPWRCHRSLIADALAARGHEVLHIFGAAKVEPHRMTPFARVEDGRVRYPRD
jgi:uncharacterized protein (DUF488 family)